MPKNSSRSSALAAAQERYVAKLSKEGRRRLPGGFIPTDCDEILQSIQDRDGIPLQTAIWLCVREYAERRKIKSIKPE